MAQRTVELGASAALEARTEFRKYKLRDESLAARFLDALSDARRLIGDHPEIAQLWTDRPTRVPVRRFVMRGFPFSLFYVVREDAIWILAVAHGRREPGYWLSRLERDP